MSEFNVSYNQLVSAIGAEKALELSIKLGGSAVYFPIPTRITSRSRIAQMIGVEAAKTLGAEFGPAHALIPIGPGRRARIWAMRVAGWSVNAIALEVGCTCRTVYNILGGKQPGLLPAVPPPPRRSRVSPPSTDECQSGEVAAAEEWPGSRKEGEVQ